MKGFASILAVAAAGLRVVNAIDIDINSTGQSYALLRIESTES